MSDTNVVEVLEHELTQKQYPRLYKLAKADMDRFLVVLKVFRDHCTEGNVLSALKTLEDSEPVSIFGMSVDPFSYPAVYCWYKTNPESFTKFFKESVEKMWSGDRDEALKMLETYFEKGFK